MGYWPYAYSNNYYYGSSYYDPSYYDTYSAPYQSYSSPSAAYPAQAAPAGAELVIPAALSQARLDVIVPDPNAEVWIQGTKTTSTGARRHYVSPELARGSTYTYTVKCAWDRGNGMVTEQRAVQVTAGATAVVDFTQPAARSQ